MRILSPASSTKAHRRAAFKLLLLPDDVLLSAGEEGRIRHWKFDANSLDLSPTGITRTDFWLLTRLARSQHGHLLCGGPARPAVVYALEDATHPLTRIQTLKHAPSPDEEDSGELVELSNGGLITLGGGGTPPAVWRWNHSDGKYEPHQVLEDDTLWDIAECASGDLAAASFQGHMSLWTLNRQDQLFRRTAQWPAHEGRVDSLLALSTGPILSGGSDGFVRMWEAAEKHRPILQAEYRPSESSIGKLAEPSPGIVIAAIPGRRAWRRERRIVPTWQAFGLEGDHLQPLASHPGSLVCLERESMVIQPSRGKLEIRSVRPPFEVLHMLHGGHRKAVLHAMLTQEGNWMTSGEDGRIVIWRS